MDQAEDVAKKAEARQTSPTKTISKSLTTQQIVLAGGMILGLYLFVYVWKKIKPGEGLMVGLIGLAIIYLLSIKGERGIMPIKEVKELLKKELRYMQKETKEIPPGRISMNVHFKLKNFDYKPNRYYIKFTIETWSNLKKIFVAECDPYNGGMLAITEHREGWDGTEIKADVQIVRLKEDRWKEEYGRYRH